MRRIDTNNIKAATYLAFALIPLSGFVLDIYISSLPEMYTQLHTTPAAIQFTLSIYLITYRISQLLIGAFLDSIGRFLPSTIALFLFSLSSFYYKPMVQYALYPFSLYNNTAYWNRFYIQYRIFIVLPDLQLMGKSKWLIRRRVHYIYRSF